MAQTFSMFALVRGCSGEGCPVVCITRPVVAYVDCDAAGHRSKPEMLIIGDRFLFQRLREKLKANLVQSLLHSKCLDRAEQESAMLAQQMLWDAQKSLSSLQSVQEETKGPIL